MSDVNNGPVSFWSTVKWPRGQGILVVGGGTFLLLMLGLARHEPLYGPVYGIVVAGIALPVLALAWAFVRVTSAWVRWPSASLAGRWSKATFRFFFLGPDG